MLELFSIWLILLWAAFPCTAWLMRFFIKKRIHGIVLYLITLVIGYFLFVGCAWISDVVAEQRMNSFDLDGDGGIGGHELTPEARKAMDDWASDTGRTLAIFTGLPLTAIWSATCLIPLCFGEWIIRRLIRSRKPEASKNEVVGQPTDDGNPFMPPGSL
jgi:hypothetical protein